MFGDTNYLATRAPAFLHADENVRRFSPPCIHEREDIFEQFTFRLVVGSPERVLLLLEV